MFALKARQSPYTKQKERPRYRRGFDPFPCVQKIWRFSMQDIKQNAILYLERWFISNYFWFDLDTKLLISL